tara:strand:+ start:6053 stop:6313 length:261 start_codon:yes stop_codon:yes gene_type:complete
MGKRKEFVSKAVELRASTNGKKKITDHEIANIIDNVDKNTCTEQEFQIEFIKALYSVFGWAYYTQEELKDESNKIHLVVSNYKNSN